MSCKYAYIINRASTGRLEIGISSSLSSRVRDTTSTRWENLYSPCSHAISSIFYLCDMDDWLAQHYKYLFCLLKGVFGIFKLLVSLQNQDKQNRLFSLFSQILIYLLRYNPCYLLRSTVILFKNSELPVSALFTCFLCL